MKPKTMTVSRARFAKLYRQKLQERSAILYTRELERWNRKPPRTGY
jgi:hypothetical protein